MFPDCSVPGERRTGCSGKQHGGREGGAVALAQSSRSHCCRQGRKMAVLLLLLFSVGALFLSSNAQEAYDNLPETYRKGVDLTLEKLKAHDRIHHHFLFLRSITKSEIEVHVFSIVRMYLLLCCGSLASSFL